MVAGKGRNEEDDLTPVEAGLAAGAAIMALLALRIPIAVALAVVSISGILMIRGPRAALGSLGTMPYDFASHWTLSAVPLFLPMGGVAYHGGLTRSLYAAGRVWLGRLPGGLAIATSFASAGFAAASGSSVATTAAMGRLAIPEMMAQRYDPGLATSVVAAAGTLGALIPPSIAFVIYGWYAEEPIGELLVAGIIPGLLTALIYSLMIAGRCMISPDLAPRPEIRATWAENWQALIAVWPIPLLIFCVVGGIYSGLVTATEAASLGALSAILIVSLRGDMSWDVLRESMRDALLTTASIFFIAIGAVLLTRFLALAGITSYLASEFSASGISPLTIILMITAVYLILGMFLDPIGVMLLTLPILIPICRSAGMDLIWLGVIVVKYIEIGLITPPVGLQAFVVKSVVGDKVSLGRIFKGLSWFIAAEAVIMALLIGFPALSTWLPSTIGE